MSAPLASEEHEKVTHLLLPLGQECLLSWGEDSGQVIQRSDTRPRRGRQWVGSNGGRGLDVCRDGICSAEEVGQQREPCPPEFMLHRRQFVSLLASEAKDEAHTMESLS